MQTASSRALVLAALVMALAPVGAEPAAAQDAAMRAFGQPGVNWFMAIVVGAIAGWLAEKFTSADLGFFATIIMGILGALLGNWLAGLLGIGVYGFFANLVSATIGVVIIITAYRAIRGRSATY